MMNVTTPSGQERVVERDIVKLTSNRGEAGTDVVTVEEPLEIQIHKEPIAVVMRTPKEGIIRSPGELGAVSYCETAEPPNRENVIEVRLADGASFDVEQLKRNFYASSSCGICGKASIDQIKTQAAPIEADFRIRSGMLYELSGRLRQSQAVFEQTGSLHAAGLFDAAGELLALREDVGRHNAVDKVVGSFVLRDKLLPKESVLMVSGRTSFEIVQKALMAGIPFVAAVSAPSSLAVDLAREANMTLVGFLRGRGCNVYSGENRVTRD
jgi:FdhD protein